ncbi:MAG: metalloregulator ArsR/SmtB family transcription factor [Candidatus Devosia euplotis]|nr:metalloregulator ArsR/SmtB family transcription factor [Candidatus Devosia euplotis]
MHRDAISMTLSALANPTRRAILARLSNGEANINELAEPFEMTLQAVSRHIKVLEDSGLVSRRRQAQSRICRFEPARLQAVDDWLERYRHFWGGSFDRMATLIDAMTNQKDDEPRR